MRKEREEEKEIRWIGSSYNDILDFPDEARRKAGFQLGRLQAGLEPESWKPFGVAGAGVNEIRVNDSSGAYRVMYVAKFDEAIYVLHCFQKKTEAATRHDKEIVEVRHRSVIRERAANP